MILFGAGGHGKVVLSLLENQQMNLTAIIDSDPKITEMLGHAVQHADNFDILPEMHMIISIGDNRIRQEKAEQYGSYSFGNLAHTTALVSNHVRIRPGTVLMPYTVIHPSCDIGRHCIINTQSVIEHDGEIGDFVHTAPGSIICGGVSIGQGAMIGAGAVVLPYVKVGAWCTVGAGAVVTADVPAGSTVVGNPARILHNDS